MHITDFLKRMSMISHTTLTLFDAEGKMTGQYGDFLTQPEWEMIDLFYKNRLDLIEHRNPLAEAFSNNIMMAMIRGNSGEVCIVGPVNVGMVFYVNDGKDAVRTASEGLEDEFYQLVLLLYEYMTDRTMTQKEIMDANSGILNPHEISRQYAESTMFERMENGWYHTSYRQEWREQESIKNGDLEGLQKALEEKSVGKIGVLAKDPVRSMKNNCIVVLSLASRSAIQGGLNSEVAYSLHDSYAYQIEEETDPNKLVAILRTAEKDLTRQVNEVNMKKGMHPLIDQCLNVIFMNLHNKISVAQLAEELKTNADYLSRLFHEKMGMTIMDYCKKEKVRLAKNLLMYSDYSIEDIAYYLGFSSQSHFGKVFREIAGATPKKYKTLHRSSDFFEHYDNK